MAVKPLVWLGSSRMDVQRFPKDARQVAGHELFQVQLGLAPGNWKPMKTVGRGVVELRVQVSGAFRVRYLAKFEEAVYVLHAFPEADAAHRSGGYRVGAETVAGPGAAASGAALGGGYGN